VETAEQSELLLSLGCHCMQGYGIARPMPAHAFPDWIKQWQNQTEIVNVNFHV
jgi:EAL domain-containing protein (putative c-di-GMP-specific phosphodiesterase class I)